MEHWQLRQLQSLPLEAKVARTEMRIREWYNHWEGQVYISFSGGKDSRALLHITRRLYPHIPAVFADTGLEYPEIREFVKQFDNVIWLKPKMHFKKVIEKYGYPVISKRVANLLSCFNNPEANNQATRRVRLEGITRDGRQLSSDRYVIPKKWRFLANGPFKISDYCCDIMKKHPLDEYAEKTGRVPLTGTMASESRQRIRIYLARRGCNSFEGKYPYSQPLGIWTEQDVLKYLKDNELSIASCYGEIVRKDDLNKLMLLKSDTLTTTGLNRTGCMFCMFGVHLQPEPNRFQQMKITHPKQYDYCINKLGIGKVLDYIGVKY